MARKDADLKVGFIGVGKMGSTLMCGMLEDELAVKGCVFAFDVAAACKAAATKAGAVWKTPAEMARVCDILFICVKPDQFAGLARELNGRLSSGACVVSVMAGATLDRISTALGPGPGFIRVMPNLAAGIREGVAAVSRGNGVSEKHYKFIIGFFEAMGGAVEVPEGKMNAVTALSGSGPAYVMMLVEALVDGGIYVGLDRGTATKLALRTVVGAGKLAEATGVEPALLRAGVSSPGGTTIEAVSVLERRGFRGAVIDAVAAACEKAAKLAGK